MPRVRATQRFKIVQCYECGCDIRVGSNSRRPKRCAECGVKAYEDNAMQLHRKEGPLWDNYREKLRKSLDL